MFCVLLVIFDLLNLDEIAYFVCKLCANLICTQNT